MSRAGTPSARNAWRRAWARGNEAVGLVAGAADGAAPWEVDAAVGSATVAGTGLATGPREKAVGNAMTTTTTIATTIATRKMLFGMVHRGRADSRHPLFGLLLTKRRARGGSEASPAPLRSEWVNESGRADLHANSLGPRAETGPVISEGLDPILIQVTIPLPVPMIYAAFTDPAQITNWLADGAQVTAKAGGTYHLSWRGSTPFESPGKIVRMTPDLDIGFSWFAPPPFERLMNHPEPRTQVYVRLQESPEGVDITLEHEGWGASEPWEEARSWHFHFWEERLTRLKDYLIKTAYG